MDKAILGVGCMMHACRYDACIYDAAEILSRMDEPTDKTILGVG